MFIDFEIVQEKRKQDFLKSQLENSLSSKEYTKELFSDLKLLLRECINYNNKLDEVNVILSNAIDDIKQVTREY